ncbi:MAG: EamA family transporter [Candidatus Zixiibacteriota bacterium]|nr:MAG: EamA family transporter [candidate division Zixibacteria bacterium]
MAGICYPIAKYGLGHIEPFTFAFYRFILASVFLLVLTRLKKNDRPVERHDWPRIVLLAVLIIPLNQTLFLVGQALTGAGHGAFIFSTTPIWIFLLAFIHLGERMKLRRLFGFVIATAGVMAIMMSGAVQIGQEYLIGDLIIMVSVIAWAYYTVVGKDLVRKYGALRMTAYALSIGSAIYFPFGLYHAIQFDYSRSTLAAWGSVVYMAIGLSVVVYVLWYWLLKYMDASRMAVYHNIQPIIATAVAVSFLGETLSLWYVVGGTAVIAGVLVTEV